MKLLTADSLSQPDTPIVALFGAGLIGTAIATELRKAARLNETLLELDWNQPQHFSEQLAVFEQRMADLLRGATNAVSTPRVRVVWSAGQAGFHSSHEDVAREFDRFNEVICCVERLSDRFPESAWTILLISSAGGLYEGQQHVDAHSVPTPTRPYSFLKLSQEQRLHDCPTLITKKIYRPTSVYGYVRNHQRRGLIPTLIADGIRRRASQITGHPTTLRDYVWIEDIAKYLARVILDQRLCNQETVEILGSSKPTSIFEIQQMIERVLHRPLYLQFTTPNGNGNHITFSSDALPANWTSSELETNIRKIAADALDRPAISLEAS